MIRVKRGLDLPILGAPEQRITQGADVSTVALLGSDYVGMKPSMAVSEGEFVLKGQLLFTDKKNPGVRYTAPESGSVVAINRGERRVFQSLVIHVEPGEETVYTAFNGMAKKEISAESVETLMNEAGLWNALRTRPFSKVPALGSRPSSIFVTAIDTHPLSANPEVIISEEAESFEKGINILAQLCRNRVFLCKAPGTIIPSGIAVVEEFVGPHPSGLPSTHIAHLDPVSENKTVWQINYQDVIAVGKLFLEGKLWTDRVIALSGPQVKNPRLLRVSLGSCVKQLTNGELVTGTSRLISGSVFGGRSADVEPCCYLGRYHNQITVLAEEKERYFLSWLNFFAHRHSVKNILVSNFSENRLYDFTTSTNGSARAMVPVGSYEQVMPLDILATQLLRALIVGDFEMAKKLGALELEEEDLALCSYVCPSKYEYGPILRDNLSRIEQEG